MTVNFSSDGLAALEHGTQMANRIHFSARNVSSYFPASHGVQFPVLPGSDVPSRWTGRQSSGPSRSSSPPFRGIYLPAKHAKHPKHLVAIVYLPFVHRLEWFLLSRANLPIRQFLQSCSSSCASTPNDSLYSLNRPFGHKSHEGALFSLCMSQRGKHHNQPFHHAWWKRLRWGYGRDQHHKTYTDSQLIRISTSFAYSTLGHPSRSLCSWGIVNTENVHVPIRPCTGP